MKKYLYKLIIKSLHLLQPELAHYIVMHFLNLKLFKLKKPPNYDNLKLKFCNIPLPNPIGLAAGFDKNGNVIPGLFSLGFGFIQPEGGGKDIFVHVTAVREAGLETLDENQEVEFEMVDGRDGRQCAGGLKLATD